jgi:hypothetical protein
VWYYFGDHRLLGSSVLSAVLYVATYRYSVPGTNKDSVKRLVRPKLPDIVETERRLGDTNTTPRGKHQNEEGILDGQQTVQFS